MNGLHEGSLALKKSLEGGFRAMVADGTGKVVAHGNLHPMDVLKAAAAAAAIWQVLSVAVAQKHLADIGQKLRIIASGIRNIQDWLHHEQQGKLEGNLQYLTTVATCFLEGRLTEQDLLTYRVHFEEIERETIQIVRSIELGQERLRTKLPSIELKEWFGTKHDTEAIRTEIREHKRLSSAWILAMHVRAAACQLSCALPGEQPVAERRLSDIQTALNGSASWKAAASLFEDLIDNKLASRWNFERTLLERRQQLRAELRTVDVWAADNEARITETLGQIKDTIASEAIEFSQPMKIAVEVTTASEVVAVHRIIDG